MIKIEIVEVGSMEEMERLIAEAPEHVRIWTRWGTTGIEQIEPPDQIEAVTNEH